MKLKPDQFRQLAALIESGIAADEALRSLTHTDKKPFSGKPANQASFSQTLAEVKLITAPDRDLLQISEDAGKLSSGLNHLAAWKEKSGRRSQSQIRRLLVLELLALLTISAGVFLQLTKTADSIYPLMLEAGLLVLYCLLLTRGTRWLITSDPVPWLSLLWQSGLGRIIPACSRRIEQRLYTALHWQLDAGIPADSTVESLSALLHARSFKQSVGLASGHLARGEKLFSSLSQERLILTAELSEIIRSGESSGRLDQLLAHHLERQQSVVDDDADLLSAWIPRLLYLPVLILAASATG